jgi:hypothetical protein
MELNIMKKNQHKIILLLAFCLLGFSQIIWAQSDYTISESKSNDMKLSGTSSLHDWDMNAHDFMDAIKLDFNVVYANNNIN